MKKYFTILCSWLFILHAGAQELNHKSISNLLISRMDLKPGEKVFIIGSPERFDSTIHYVRQQVRKVGAFDMGAISAEINEHGAPPEYPNLLSRIDSILIKTMKPILNEVDIAILFPGAELSPLYAAMQEVLKEGRGRTIHFHWAGAFAMDGKPLVMDEAINSQYVNALLNTDYDALANKMIEFEKSVRVNEIHVTTPTGTDLKFEVGDRPVTRQDGDASLERTKSARNLIDREIELPAGAVRLAPIEETVNGVVNIPISYWHGQRVENLMLTFNEGKIIDMEATKGLEAVKGEMEQGGEASQFFREFALGFNPLLKITEQTPWLGYYGYGAGIVRLSLGDNSELGGAVRGRYVRWNLFPDATVLVGKDIWVKDGELVK